LSDAADATLLNVVAAKFAGSTTLFAGSATKLYKFATNDMDMDNVSKSGDYSSVARWRFTTFGNKLIAACKQAKLQAWTLNSSSLFADLNAAAPQAQYVTTVRDFVVAGNVASYENKVYWSDINDSADWTAGSGSQADTQVIPDGGDIVGLTGGEFGLVLLEKAIVRMHYVGAPFFFQFDVISRNIGCMEPNSVIQYGNNTFFLSEGGFYMCNGSHLTPIGTQKVNNFFFENANAGSYADMSAAVDPEKNLILWSYTNTANTKSILIYNYQLNRWSQADTTATILATAATATTTLEALDNYSASLDALETSLDSRLWAGGQFILAGADDTKLVTFSGVASTAELITGDIEVAGQNTVVQLARPRVNNGSGSVSVASRFRADEAVTYSDATAATTENRVPLRSVGRYHRLKLTPSGSWTDALGVDVEMASTGER